MDSKELKNVSLTVAVCDSIATIENVSIKK